MTGSPVEDSVTGVEAADRTRADTAVDSPGALREHLLGRLDGET